MLRGINQQQIFEDEEDYDKFLQILKECKEVSEYRLLAYCLMGNHVTQGTEMCVGGVTQTGVCFEQLEIPSVTPRHTISTPNAPKTSSFSHLYG